MPGLSNPTTQSLKAFDIMKKTYMYLTKQTKLKEIPIIIAKTGKHSVTIPVVESEENK